MSDYYSMNSSPVDSIIGFQSCATNDRDDDQMSPIAAAVSRCYNNDCVPSEVPLQVINIYTFIYIYIISVIYQKCFGGYIYLCGHVEGIRRYYNIFTMPIKMYVKNYC